MPSITGDAVNALTGTLKIKADEQNFGPDDSKIASAFLHPVVGFTKAMQWLQEQMQTAAGMPIPGEQDEASMYQTGPTGEQQAQAGLNIAGMAQVGSMPMAPRSAGGTLGTSVIPGYDKRPDLNTSYDTVAMMRAKAAQMAGKPMVGTGSRGDVGVGMGANSLVNGMTQGRGLPPNIPIQTRAMRDYMPGKYKPEGIFSEPDPNILARLLARNARK